MDDKLSNKKESRHSLYSFFISRFIEKNCLRVILWGTYLILFTPFIISGKFFFPFVSPKSLYFMALVEIIFAVYLFLAISLPKYRPKFNILLIAIILFIAVSILSAVLGADLSGSFWSKYERMTGLLMWFHLLAFFVATSSVFKKKDWIRILEISVMVAVLISILALFTDRGMGPLVNAGLQTRQGATLGNSSFLASYLLFNVFLALYLFLIQAKKELKIIFGSSFVLIAVALFLSGGRAATLAFLGGTVLLFFLRLIFCKKRKLRLAGILLLTIFLASGMLIIYFSLEMEGNTVQRILADKFSVGVGRSRLLVWGIGLNGWQEKPWLGWGPGNFNLVFAKHFDSCILLPGYGADIWYDRAHNIVVDTLTTTGILGLLSYFGIFASVFYALWKKYLSRKIDFLTVGIVSVILISYFLQNLTVFDMVGSFMMFFLVLGFVGSIISQKESDSADSDEKTASPKPWVAVIILIFFIVSFFNFVIQPLRSNCYLIEAFRIQDSKERFSLYEKSLEISPLGKYQMRETIVNREIMKYSQQEVVEKIPLEVQEREFNFMSQELEKSIEESPFLFSSYLPLGRVYNAYGRIDPSKFNRAEEVMEKATEEVSPGNQQGYWVLTQTKLFQGKFDEALLAVEKSVEIEPGVKKSNLIMIEVVAMISSLTGNEDLLKEKVELVLKANPDWAPDIQWILERRGSR